MKKQNVIDMTTYRDELSGNTPATDMPSASPTEISEELKVAIEVLIDRLRSNNNGNINQ